MAAPTNVLQREESSCQPGAVHTWPKADIRETPANVRFRGQSAQALFSSSAAGGWLVNGAPPFSLPDAGDSTAVRLSAPGAVRHDVAHQVVHVVLQISDDVLDDVSDRDHAHDLARVQHW